MIKPIAMYLPQFHEIPENNLAWGEGFTEWTNVKKAKPLFKGHYQPRVPLNNYYYNLLDIETLRWQALIAKEHGIYGFCFYHYWFSGKMVLERPIKILHESSDININFCFAWANESWTKTWHGAGGEREILLAQRYGDKKEWEDHYKYFREVFKDKRYIKVGNKPMVLVYRVRNIPEFNPMFRLWNRLAINDGFEGVYIISMNTGNDYVHNSEWVNATMDFEPNRTKAEVLKQGDTSGVKTIDYDRINAITINKPHDETEYRTAFVDYDDTPRRGIQGVVTEGADPQKFGNYLRKMVMLSKKESKEYIFINAWNEWGEGNYLEPDMKNGYAYLDELKKAIKGEY